MRPRPAPRVVAWVLSQATAELFTTSIAEAEIFYGIELLERGKRRDRLATAAEGMFAEEFAGRVLGFEGEAARVYAEIAAKRRAAGKPISHADAQIAAIARVRGAKLATRNVNDFSECGVEVIDPWEEP
jgi:toxin FitB